MTLLVALTLACEPVRVTDLTPMFIAGEAALVAMDEAELHAAVTALDAALPCLVDRLEPTPVGAIHRLYGYGAFVKGDTLGARASFGAARSADPKWAMPDTLAPPGTELRERFNTAPVDTFGDVVAVPTGTTLYIDGQRNNERSTDRPVIAQLLQGERLVATAYLTPQTPLPDWRNFAVAVVLPDAPRAPQRSALPWWGATAGALLAGGACYTWAYLDHQRYMEDDPALDEAALARIRQGANVKVVSAGALGAVGVGLGVVALTW